MRTTGQPGKKTPIPYWIQVFAVSGVVYAILSMMLGLVPFFFPAWCGGTLGYLYVFVFDLLLSGLLILACTLILRTHLFGGKVLLAVYSLVKLLENVSLAFLEEGYANPELLIVASVVPIFILGVCLFAPRLARSSRTSGGCPVARHPCVFSVPPCLRERNSAGFSNEGKEARGRGRGIAGGNG